MGPPASQRSGRKREAVAARESSAGTGAAARCGVQETHKEP